jgi:F-type H+-transporting ATPase subunit delta
MTTSLKPYAEAYVRALPASADAVAAFDACATTINAIKQLRAFLDDVSVPINIRRDALKTAFPKAETETINFIALLAQDGLIDKLEHLQTLIRSAAAVRHNKRHAIVTAAVTLTDKDLDRISNALAKKLGSDIQLEERTDPSLLTGLRVEADGWTFDASLKGRLDRLHHALTV